MLDGRHNLHHADFLWSELDQSICYEDANTQQVKVPYGEFAPHARISTVQAPILRVSRTYGSWIGRGLFTGSAVVEKVRASVVEEGPLRLVYRIEYALAGGKSYAVVLTVQAGDTFITVDEHLGNLAREDRLSFNFSYRDGIDPDGRIGEFYDRI